MAKAIRKWQRLLLPCHVQLYETICPKTLSHTVEGNPRDKIKHA